MHKNRSRTNACAEAHQKRNRSNTRRVHVQCTRIYASRETRSTPLRYRNESGKLPPLPLRELQTEKQQANERLVGKWCYKSHIYWKRSLVCTCMFADRVSLESRVLGRERQK